MIPSDITPESLEAGFVGMLDAGFRRAGVQGGLPPAMRDAVLATPRHRFVHRFRVGDGPLRDADADPANTLALIYSDAVMRHVDAAGEALPSSNSQPSYVLYLLHLLSSAAGSGLAGDRLRLGVARGRGGSPGRAGGTGGRD